MALTELEQEQQLYVERNEKCTRVTVTAGDAVVTVWWDEDGALNIGVLENEEPDILVHPGEHAEPVVRHNGLWQS